MANYRQIHTQIWRDNWFLDLAADEKLLFIYLFSNDASSLSGLYEIHERLIALETGLSPKRIKAILAKFEEANKVHYADGIVWIVNMQRYHPSSSYKVQTRIQKDIDSISDCEIKRKYLIHYGSQLKDTLSNDSKQPTDSISIPYPYEEEEEEEYKEEEEEEQEKEEESENPPDGGMYVRPDPVSQVCEYYKAKKGSIAPNEAAALSELAAVFRVMDIKAAIDHMMQSTPRPNTGYLKKVLAGWFSEKKIRKIY
jgi:hypothetical protein